MDLLREVLENLVVKHDGIEVPWDPLLYTNPLDFSGKCKLFWKNAKQGGKLIEKEITFTVVGNYISIHPNIHKLSNYKNFIELLIDIYDQMTREYCPA